MLHNVMRQRRRFAFALILTQIALYGLWPQTAVFGAMIVGLFAGMVLVSATGHPVRRLIECGAIGLLLASRMPTPLLVCVTLLAGTAAAYAVLYMPLLDRAPFRLRLRSRKTFDVALDQRTTWQKLIPGQGHPAAYWTGTMRQVRADPHDDGTLYITYQDEDGAIEEVTITFLHLVPYTSARFLIENDTDLAGEEVILSYHLAPGQGDETTITSDMRVSGLPLRHAAERFFDDVLGDELDSFATMTSCRRSWKVRSGPIDLTSELGRDGIRLSLPTEATETTVEAEIDAEAARRMSA